MTDTITLYELNLYVENNDGYDLNLIIAVEDPEVENYSVPELLSYLKGKVTDDDYNCVKTALTNDLVSCVSTEYLEDDLTHTTELHEVIIHENHCGQED